MISMSKLIAVYTLLIIALLFVCDNDYSRKYYVPLKTACSASFLLMSFVIDTVGFFNLLMLPLVSCFIGDIFMGQYNVRKARSSLYTGIGAFLVAHILFLIYMTQTVPGISLVNAILPVFVVILMLWLVRTFHLHMGKVLYFSTIYCYMVTAMCLKALEIGGLTMMGGILFFLSDFTIIFLYFYHFAKIQNKKIVHYLNLVTYYLGILFFILGS